MERVAFLLEETGDRLGCLLNPESLVVRRLAGVRPRRSVSGALTGAGLADDPLLHTGGGMTELLLDLLFDVSIAGSSITTEDVRDLTAPLWALAENAHSEDGYGRPRLARFVWGKGWNIPGLVAAIAERLESFTPAGTPRRSWLRLRFLRTADTPPAPGEPPDFSVEPPPELLSPTGESPAEEVRMHQYAAGERLEEIVHRYYGHYGHPLLWRCLAAFNQIDDPMHIPAGRLLRIPSLSLLRRIR